MVRGSWVMVKGARHRPVVARPVVAVACPLPRVAVLLISKRGWEEHGMVGYLPCVLKSTTNDIHRLSFGRHVTVSDVAPGFHEVGSRCYSWVVAFIGKQSFPFISGCLHSWAVVFVVDCRWRWAQCGGCHRWCRYAVVVVTNIVVGGGKKRVAMFVKYDDKQTLFVVCYK